MQSYGGHYVPAVSTGILAHNKGHAGPHINLKGFAIGNGMALYRPYIKLSFCSIYRAFSLPTCRPDRARKAVLPVRGLLGLQGPN